MKVNRYGKAFSKWYFQTRRKFDTKMDDYIEKNVEVAKRNFRKTHGIEAKEQDIREIKREIVLKKGLSVFVGVVILFLCILLL